MNPRGMGTFRLLIIMPAASQTILSGSVHPDVVQINRVCIPVCKYTAYSDSSAYLPAVKPVTPTPVFPEVSVLLLIFAIFLYWTGPK